eukprot:jgi/Mesvir1/6675/Mv08904-RA.1
MMDARTMSKQKSRREAELESKLERLKVDNKKQKESLLRKKKRLDGLSAENARLLQQLGKEPMRKSAESDSEDMASAPVSAAPSQGGSPTHASMKSGPPSCVGDGDQLESQSVGSLADRVALAQGYRALEEAMAIAENTGAKWAESVAFIEEERNDLKKKIALVLSEVNALRDEFARLREEYTEKFTTLQTIHELRFAQMRTDYSISVEELRMETAAFYPAALAASPEKVRAPESATAAQLQSLQFLLQERINEIATLQQMLKSADDARQKLEEEVKELRHQNSDLSARMAEDSATAAEKDRQQVATIGRLTAENEAQRCEVEAQRCKVEELQQTRECAPASAQTDIAGEAEKEAPAPGKASGAAETPVPPAKPLSKQPRGVHIPLGLLLPAVLFLLLGLAGVLLGPVDEVFRALATSIQGSRLLNRPT